MIDSNKESHLLSQAAQASKIEQNQLENKTMEKQSPKSIRFTCSRCSKEGLLRSSDLITTFNPQTILCRSCRREELVKGVDFKCCTCGKVRHVKKLSKEQQELLAQDKLECSFCTGMRIREQTLREKYGENVRNINQIPGVTEKQVQHRRENQIKKTGFAHPRQSEETEKRKLQDTLKKQQRHEAFEKRKQKNADLKSKVSFICKKCGKTRMVTKVNLPENGICGYCKILENRKQTCLERYGVDTYLKLPELRQKANAIRLEHYGSICGRLQDADVREKAIANSHSEAANIKRRSTNLERRGVDNPRKDPTIVAKIQRKILEKVATELRVDDYDASVNCYFQSTVAKDKYKQTCQSRYGVDYYFQSAVAKDKCKQTCLEKYGVEYYVQSKEAQSKRKQSYRYDGANFDSKPELAFYIYYKEHGVEIQRCTQRFDYEFRGKIHRYFPDFIVDGELVEIKGDQFLNEATNSWQNPFDHSQDGMYEAKHQCALKNNVKILYSEDYQKCIDYVIEKHGRDFFEKCKI